jgi:type III secretion system YscJ/HrcJ family lipoprotein
MRAGRERGTKPAVVRREPQAALRRVPVVLSLCLLATACAQETIAHQQEERFANKMLVLLADEGIEAQKLKDETSRELRFNIVVAKEKAPTALNVLERHNLPETRREGTAELFKEGGMIPTNTQERAKREVGVAGDIVNNLRRVPRVVDASALVSIPEDNPLRDVNEAKPKPKASVLIAYLPDADNRPPLSVEDVQRFVQASLPELKTAEVSVQMIPHTGGGGPDPAMAGSTGGGTPTLAANACERDAVLGIEVCAGGKKKLINGIIVVIIVAGVLSAMAVIAVFRAMRYRKDLTRLTAQVAQIRK